MSAGIGNRKERPREIFAKIRPGEPSCTSGGNAGRSESRVLGPDARKVRGAPPTGDLHAGLVEVRGGHAQALTRGSCRGGGRNGALG